MAFFRWWTLTHNFVLGKLIIMPFSPRKLYLLHEWAPSRPEHMQCLHKQSVECFDKRIANYTWKSMLLRMSDFSFRRGIIAGWWRDGVRVIHCWRRKNAAVRHLKHHKLAVNVFEKWRRVAMSLNEKWFLMMKGTLQQINLFHWQSQLPTTCFCFGALRWRPFTGEHGWEETEKERGKDCGCWRGWREKQLICTDTEL